MTTKKIQPSPDSIAANELPEFKQWQAERTLGSVMRNWRDAEGLTQEAVAQRLGMSKQVLSAYENGHKIPSIKKTIAIAEALGASVTMWLIYRVETELRNQGLDYSVHLEKRLA